jgi:hypothetical protein
VMKALSPIGSMTERCRDAGRDRFQRSLKHTKFVFPDIKFDNENHSSLCWWRNFLVSDFSANSSSGLAVSLISRGGLLS